MLYKLLCLPIQLSTQIYTLEALEQEQRSLYSLYQVSNYIQQLVWCVYAINTVHTFEAL